MTALEQIIQAAVAAPPERQQEALRVLRGEPEPAPEPQEPLLSLSEVARHLDVNRATLWRWRLPGHDLGGRLRYRLSEVQAYLGSRAFKRRKAALRAERGARKPTRDLTPAVSGRAGVNGHRRPELNLKS